KPDDSYCRAARGYSLRTLDRYEDALDDLRRAVTIEPDYAWAHVALAHVLLDIADLPAAHEHAVRGWELDATQVWARGIEAFVKALLGDLPGARDAMQDAHERDPEELNWTQLLADMHTALGDRSGAQALYREVVERGSDATVLDTIARVGWSHRWLGEHDKAVRMYQRALSLGRRRPHYLRLDFALALLCGGQSELADHEYQRALRDIGGLSPIRVRGLLHVALYDLDLAIREMLRGEHATADRVRQLLADALATSQRSAGNAEPVPSVGASA
ncbi:MAG TPA: tetratricopeptide repeat protein, partial [Gemmatimonadaceae bacterium]|nr:tetratricopeptide repeat protein [Gemmatimonadaceae bacterium]